MDEETYKMFVEAGQHFKPDHRVQNPNSAGSSKHRDIDVPTMRDITSVIGPNSNQRLPPFNDQDAGFVPPFVGEDGPIGEASSRKLSLVKQEGLARADTSAVQIMTGRMFQHQHGESSKDHIALAMQYALVGLGSQPEQSLQNEEAKGSRQEVASPVNRTGKTQQSNLRNTIMATEKLREEMEKSVSEGPQADILS